MVEGSSKKIDKRMTRNCSLEKLEYDRYARGNECDASRGILRAVLIPDYPFHLIIT